MGDVSRPVLEIDTSLVDLNAPELSTVLDLLRVYNATRKLRKAIVGVFALNRFQTLLKLALAQEN